MDIYLNLDTVDQAHEAECWGMRKGQTVMRGHEGSSAAYGQDFWYSWIFG